MFFQSICTTPPWPPLSSSTAIRNHTLVFTSSPRPLIGSKKLFATGPQAAMRQQHDTDCTVHKEPAMLQTPSLKLSAHVLQGLAWQSIDIDPEPGWSARTECWKVCRAWSLVGAHLKISFFPCACGHGASVLAFIWEYMYVLMHAKKVFFARKY